MTDETKPKRKRRPITPATALSNTIATLEKLGDTCEALCLLKLVTGYFESKQPPTPPQPADQGDS
jgi:hypothetical protein